MLGFLEVIASVYCKLFSARPSCRSNPRRILIFRLQLSPPRWQSKELAALEFKINVSTVWFRLGERCLVSSISRGVAFYPLILLVFHFCILFCNSITRRAQLAYIHNLFHCASWSGYHQKILNTHLDHRIINSTIHMLLFHPRKNVQRHISKYPKNGYDI